MVDCILNGLFAFEGVDCIANILVGLIEEDSVIGVAFIQVFNPCYVECALLLL